MSEKNLIAKLVKKEKSMEKSLTTARNSWDHSKKINELEGFSRAIRLVKKILKEEKLWL